jgi:predicted nucleic acid-binding protein
MVAWVRDEPAADAVDSFFLDADDGRVRLLMSALNVGETYYILAKRHNLTVAEQFLKRLPSLPVHIVVPDQDGILAAARVKASHAIAYGDSFAIALAIAEKASVITGDEEIRQCGLVPVDWVGTQPH